MYVRCVAIKGHRIRIFFFFFFFVVKTPFQIITAAIRKVVFVCASKLNKKGLNMRVLIWYSICITVLVDLVGKFVDMFVKLSGRGGRFMKSGMFLLS
jgi:hypothetical protein